MKKSYFPIFLLVLLIFSPAVVSAQDAPPPKKLHGKALKEKEASLQIVQGYPNRSYQKIAPIWASKSSMERTMKGIRKQAARIGADAIIDIRVKTEKLHSTSYDPGFWGGPGGWGGWGPWGGPWGGMGYWGGYASSHTYTQPVVSGWAVRWTGPAPAVEKDTVPPKTLEQKVEDAPSE